ncbi:hypothetical protein ACFOYU_07715, partial [Microvirga sp. GCM10011540]|uniref:hypothetical protein n=1 Tax=Microvirga sp. GCM10011540 TaxID=3317338 RepID=UPI00361B83ED
DQRRTGQMKRKGQERLGPGPADPPGAAGGRAPGGRRSGLAARARLTTKLTHNKTRHERRLAEHAASGGAVGIKAATKPCGTLGRIIDAIAAAAGMSDPTHSDGAQVVKVVMIERQGHARLPFGSWKGVSRAMILRKFWCAAYTD